MKTLTALVVAVLQYLAPPGHSKYSVTPVACHAEQCSGLAWSEFYDSYVHQETVAEGAERYVGIADAIVTAAEAELCRTEDGQRIVDCVPYAAARGWRLRDLIWSTVGVAVPESGLREDVEMGRGWAKKADDVGGQGRGPGWEGCFMQVHPSTAWSFVPDLTAQERASAAATRASREALVKTLLGDGPPLVLCFRTGMRMLMQAKAHCDWDRQQRGKRFGLAAVQADPYFEMYSMYGTGTSCTAMNGSKTSYRTTVRRQAISVAEKLKHQELIARQ